MAVTQHSFPRNHKAHHVAERRSGPPRAMSTLHMPKRCMHWLDHGFPVAIDIAVCRQMNRKAADAAPDLHSYDPEG